MNNAITGIESIFDYFKNLLEVPDYYCFKFTTADTLPYDKYASIGSIDIIIISTLSFDALLKTNDIFRISDGKNVYDLLLFIDNDVMLLIDDIIKTLGGVIYEKTALQY